MANSDSATFVNHAVLATNLRSVKDRIAAACARVRRDPGGVTLVAVTKSVSATAIRALYDLGERDFAENRPQRLWRKQVQLPPDVRWHMIGHLQTNKVRRTLPTISVIHSVDRLTLAESLSKELNAIPRRLPAYIELNLTGETAKHGFSAAAVIDAYPRLIELPGLDYVGLMTMARLEETPERCRGTFAELRATRDRLRRAFPTGPALDFLSMGMSGDFEVAIEEGATHVRIGTALFEGVTE